MFYHSKELQYKARVSRPDARFARLMLEQFGGANGELSASMQYFLQAFACHNPYPEKYDMLMDIATEELGHLEIVGATIQMLLTGATGNLKEVAERGPIFEENFSKEDFIHAGFANNPQFGVVSGGGPMLSNSNGFPWQATYINANGDLTVDLRSNLASESRAKITYEYLMQFTDDKYVLDTLNFLMAREVAHYQQFEAALEGIKPNFPPGIYQCDPRYTSFYSNNSFDEQPVRAAWNEGRSTQLDEEWNYMDNPRREVLRTQGLTELKAEGSPRTPSSVEAYDKKLGKKRAEEIRSSTPKGEQCWCDYDEAREPVEA